LLIDCGNAQAVDKVLKPFLRAHGVNRLPCLVLTHGDARQTGGAARLRAGLPIREVVTSPVPFRSPSYRTFLDELKRTPGCRRVAGRGEILRKWSILHPDRDDHFPQSDDNALVLWRTLAGTRILLLSDLGEDGQEALMGRTPELRADIVIAGVPDSSEPAGEALLELLQPRLVILTDSEFPATRRAKPALRERLLRAHCRVLCLAEAGATTLCVEGTNWSVHCLGRPSQSGQENGGSGETPSPEHRTPNAEDRQSEDAFQSGDGR